MRYLQVDPVRMDASPADPFAPWLGDEDLELLQTIQDVPSPIGSQFATPTGTPSASLPSTPSSSTGNSDQASMPIVASYAVPVPVSPPTTALSVSLSPSRFLYHSPMSTTTTISNDMLSPYHYAAQPVSYQAPHYAAPPVHRSAGVALIESSPPPVQPRKTTSRASRASVSKANSTRAVVTTSPSSSSSGASSPVVGNRQMIVANDAQLSPEELRKLKNRLKVRRFYNKQKETLKTLRQEKDRLESYFKSMVQSNADAELQQLNNVTAMLADLRLEQNQLQLEQSHLQQLRVQLQACFKDLWHVLVADQELFATTPEAKSVYIKPFSVEECYAVRDKAVEEVIIVSSLGSRFKKGGGVAGWQDEVSVEENLWQFLLYKTFRHASPKKLCDATWPVLSDPHQFPRMYSAALETKCAVVQRVDENNIIMFQQYRAMDANEEFVLMKSLLLVSRVVTPTGELVLFRGLGQDRLHDRELFLPTSGELVGRIVWHDVFTWVRFNRAGLNGEHCFVQFGGSAPTVGNNMGFWSLEIVNLVMRWEFAINAPPQWIKNSDSDETIPLTGWEELDSVIEML